MGFHKSTRNPFVENQLHNETRTIETARIQRQLDEIPHANAVRDLQVLEGYSWKTDAFKQCIQEHFGVLPERLKNSQYPAARKLMADGAQYRKYHFGIYNAHKSAVSPYFNSPLKTKKRS